jgi:membrane-associated phospholipid phosphatase
MSARAKFHLAVVLLGCCTAAWAQMENHVAGPSAPDGDAGVAAGIDALHAILDSRRTRDGYLPPGEDPQNRLFVPFVKHLASDQEHFWTMRDLHRDSWRPLIPFAAFTGLMFAGDSWISQQVPDSPGQLQRSRNISNYALYSLLGTAGGSFVWGHVTHNDHMQETGLLSAEAALDSTGVTLFMQGITQRQRPGVGNGSGGFFQGGSSFPSEHAALAWAVASTVAHEYPGPFTKFLAYGLASTVTLTRVTGKQHFASDALVGSALGWYFARQVYRARHDRELSGGAWGTLVDDASEITRVVKHPASPYVPLDSWVYPVYDRLAALGYIHTAFLGLRPWTRVECARLLDEMTEKVPETADGGDQVFRLYRQLEIEFADERALADGAPNLGIGVDSIYTRATTISGQPLDDSFHFGQTIVDDFGRPYAQGTNLMSGASFHAEAGPLAFSFRGEFQHSPSTPAYSAGALQAIARADGVPSFSNARSTVDQGKILESMVGLRLGNVQLSFGREATSLAPTRAGSLLLSDNAAPFTALRIDSVSPFEVPLLSRILGPMRTEFFLGQLSGHEWAFDGTNFLGPKLDPQPYIHGTKISFKPTVNLEMGMGVTAVFSGEGLPFTWSNFLKTFYSHKADVAKNPGKRLSAFDLSYRVPGLRKWMTFYLDSLVVDEISPIGSTRPSLDLGLYFPQVPKIANLEFRVEGLKTTHPDVFTGSPGFVYTDRRYLSGYTNDSNILGSWIGRAGIGGQTWATYHLSPRNLLELSYRHIEIDSSFLGGGRTNDFSFRTNFMARPDFAISTFVQYEAWSAPLLTPAAKSNVTASFQFEFTPKWRIR